MNASRLIPPPTVSGILPSRDNGVARENLPGDDDDDELLSIRRSQKSLERHLQHLLDAQSDGLTEQTTKAGSAEVNATSTGTRQSLPLSLRNARRGISQAIQELAHVKARELEKVEDQQQDVQDIVLRTITWRDRRQGLEAHLQKADHGDQSVETLSLVEEDSTLQEQINAMQEKLSHLRARQTEIGRRLSQQRNARASELSSYRNSMRLLDAEVQRYLDRPLPPALLRADHASALLSLPAKRRTLEMLIEHAQGARRVLSQSRADLERESEALFEGGVVWEEAVKTIEAFERRLRQAMKDLSPMQQSMVQAPTSSKPILEDMHDTTSVLEDLLGQAESRGWTLLIAAVSQLLTISEQLYLALLLQHHHDPGKHYLTGSIRLEQKWKHSKRVEKSCKT